MVRTSDATREAPPSSALERRLGPLDAAAIIVSNVIGGGILFTPPQVAMLVPDAVFFLSTWVAGGALAFAGAMAYAELAALRPRAGGEYVYLREAFGEPAAFLTGWTSFVAGFSGAIATSAAVMVFYVGRFAPTVANAAPWAVVPIVPGRVVLTLSPQTVTAVAIIVAMAALHRRGLGPGRIAGNLLASLKVTAFVLFIALGFSLGSGRAAHLAERAPVGAAGWLLALIPVMFTYSGWNAAAYVAEEIREPGRNVPRALALGTLAVVVIYLLLNALYLYVIPVGALAAIDRSVLDVIADRLLGSSAGNVMGVVSIVSLAASISAMTLAGPRVYYAMARDGLFFRRVARVHPRYATPASAIAAQAIWSSILVLTATADALVNYTGFAIVLFSGVAVVALFVLRRRVPDAPRPFRAWGYPVAPAIYAIASAAILVNGLYRAPGPTGAGALIIAAGLPAYLLFRGGTAAARRDT
ncbi:MAG TPA: amino acid permease [Vicinamibacterales bacterium]|nr:amino acid permease [Vicinamibacterales bacterium]